MQLRNAIVFGSWQKGDKLPGENAFMQKYKVSRSLMRETLRALEAEGILERRHGSGTYLKNIPQKRLELYVRLDNLVHPAGGWFRWMMERCSEICRGLGWELEILVSYGVYQQETVKYFQRHLSRPATPELVGSILLFHCPDMELQLRQRGASFLTITQGATLPTNGNAVLLDYVGMGELMQQELNTRHIGKSALFYVNDPVSVLGGELHGELMKMRQILDRKEGIQIPVPSLEAGGKIFCQRIAEERPEAVIFCDDGLYLGALREAWLRKIDMTGITILTQGYPGLAAELPVFSPVIFGHERDQIMRAAMDLLLSRETNSRIIMPATKFK